jgi:AcrR family transcriptional regulator
MINYHFGSKANLFKTVLADVLDQRRQLQKKWYTETIPLGAARGLSRFIDYVLEDYRKGPGFFHIVSLNFFQTEDMDSIPGYELIQEFFNADADEMKDHLSLQVSDLEGDMFIRALSVMLVGFLGGTGSNAKILGMEPDSIVYYNWVRDTIIYALLPRFSKMVQNP